MSYAARTTTNNQAEYSGLLEGLRACQRGGWIPLHVIGDSMMIIRQQTGRKPPHAAHLASLYHQSRRIADMLRVLSWSHHLRAYNKMADSLANVAMDRRQSQQLAPAWPAQRTSPWSAALEHVASDVGHWLESQSNERPSGLEDDAQ